MESSDSEYDDFAEFQEGNEEVEVVAVGSDDDDDEDGDEEGGAFVTTCEDGALEGQLPPLGMGDYEDMRGCDVEALDDEPDAVELNELYRFCMEGNDAGALALISPATDPNQRSTDPKEDGRTLLMAAASNGCMPIVSMLVKMPAIRLDSKDLSGYTALIWACVKDQPTVVQALLDAGASVNQPNSFGDTPLIRACEHNRANIVTSLLRHGAAVNVANLQGHTALMKACKGSHEPIVNLLLSRGASTNLQDKVGNTALISAADAGCVPVVKALLAAGARPDDINHYGHPAILRAARRGKGAVVEALLCAGADFDGDFLPDPAIHPALVPLLYRAAAVCAKWHERRDLLVVLYESHSRFMRRAGVAPGAPGGYIEAHGLTRYPGAGASSGLGVGAGAGAGAASGAGAGAGVGAGSKGVHGRGVELQDKKGEWGMAAIKRARKYAEEHERMTSTSHPLIEAMAGRASSTEFKRKMFRYVTSFI